MKPDDIVNDAPFRRGNWEPHNYDDRFMGAMPLRKALALSRNIPAVRVLDEIGVNNATQVVRRLGLPNPMAPFPAIGARCHGRTTSCNGIGLFGVPKRWCARRARADTQGRRS
jgi:penicillin-binding protein 1A